MRAGVHPQVERQPREYELKAWHHGVIFLLACAVIISRRPDAVLNAQFWAEDGHVFFADAYNFGWWHALFRTYAGYFHAFPRLGAALSLLAPLALAPLVLNLVAICVEVLPVSILLSSRSSAWGSLAFRSILAGAYLALPNSFEMHALITDSQWLLALAAFLLLVARKPRNAGERIFDLAILLLCGLSGPFCVLLTPIALFVAWQQRNRWRWGTASILIAASAIQIWALLSGGYSGRPHYTLGASPGLLVRIIGGHVFLASLLGANGLAANPSKQVFIGLFCAFVGGLILVVFCWAKSPLAMRLFVLLTAAIFALSLISPAAYPPAGVTTWELLSRAGGIRYWFFPSLAFVWLLLFGIRSGGEVLKAILVVVMVTMCCGVVRDWRTPALADLHWAENAKHIDGAAPGTVLVIPENPAGWTINLVKR
jgi:hypothetical protein